MRTKKSLLNIIYNFSFSFINIFLSFFSRTVFLNVFTAEYLGLTTLVTNIIGVLSIMELGVASAIGYSLYKYLIDENHKKINELIKFIKITYSIVGILILIIGILIVPFFNIIFKTNIDNLIIYSTYFLFLITTVISYFITYKQVLATADQNSYIITRTSGIIKIVKTITQIGLVLTFESFFLWILIESTFNITSYILINKRISEKYKWLNIKINKNYRILLKENRDVLINLKNIIFHRIASVILYQTDTILISILLSVTQVASYANYMLIITQLTMLVGQIFNSFTASIGNLIANGNNVRSFNIFKQLFHLEFYIGICLSYSLFKMINPFIELWIGNEYWLSYTFVFVLTINFFIGITRQIVGAFKNGYGIFWDVFAPIIEGIINLVISVYLAINYGITGILIGTLVSLIIVIVGWQPYILYKQGFKQPFIKHIVMYAKLLILSLVSIFIIEKVIRIESVLNFLSIENQYIDFFISGIIHVILIGILYGLFLLSSRPFRDSLARIFKFLKSSSVRLNG